MGTDAVPRRRSLPFVGLVAAIVVYLAIIGVAHLVSTSSLDNLDYGRFPDITTIVRATVIPVALSIVFCVAIINSLGWWMPVLRNDPPVQRWVLLIPTALFGAIVAGTDYGTLSDKGTAYTVWLLVASLMIGLGEELMFRGIAVAALRLKGRTETTVALWTSVLFGAAHAVNWFVDGGGNVLQIVTTMFMGWFLYLTRRATRGLLVPIVLHGLWDFGLFTGNVTSPIYGGVIVFLTVELLLIPVVLVRRRRIEVVAA